jgi:LmbE family N-acetylglucosaminyl deacetylase
MGVRVTPGVPCATMEPMAGTLVSFHAHPDDEAIQTGGVLARAKAEGHRVVLVIATGGEHGEVAEGFLTDGESLAERRALETAASARVLGIDRLAFLGYVDSGMDGTPQNHAPGSFWGADVDEAATRLAAILQEEDAEVLTVYDDNGGYGHPDHVQVHRVGVRAAELALTPRVYEATMNRDAIRSLMVEIADELRAAGTELPEPVRNPEDLELGVPGDRITTTVDVGEFIDAKRAALAAHASQVDESSFFLAMPAQHFRRAFGQEWFIRRDAPAGTSETWLF